MPSTQNHTAQPSHLDTAQSKPSATSVSSSSEFRDVGILSSLREQISDIVKIEMIADVIAVVDFLEKHATRADVFKALFDSEAQRLSGSPEIVVDKLVDPGDANHWFYHVRPVEGYEFIYMPTIPSVAFNFGRPSDSSHADAKYFRFIDNPALAITVGGVKNVKVNFVVYGYRRDSFLDLTFKQ